MSFLDKILPAKIVEVERYSERFAERGPIRPQDWPIRDFSRALADGGGVIAEVKKKSPSHPTFQQFAPPGRLARAYRRGGARALSIVTDKEHFGTGLADIAELRAAVDLPILAKDFIIDPVQVMAAWAAGADAVLLIVRMLEQRQLKVLMAAVEDLGLQTLVECHDWRDIRLAEACGAELLGVNNRNLATLETDLAHGESLLGEIQGPALRISESGLNTRSDVLRLQRAGADAFLIGHALLRSKDPGRKVAELTGRAAEKGTRVKVCGITRPEDARTAYEAGADLLGVIFAESPRRVSLDEGLTIRAAVPDARLCGVFMDQEMDQVVESASACDLDLVQLHGAETPEYCAELVWRTGLPLIKAFTPDEISEQTIKTYQAAAYFLVDLPKSTQAGSASSDDVLRAARFLHDQGQESFVAGGLNPDTVAGVLSSCPAFAVDVSSGVEQSPGVKDPRLVHRFLEEARS